MCFEVQGDLEALWPEGLVDATPVKPHLPPTLRVVDLEAMNFGQGRFAYLSEPLPQPLQALRGALYEALAPVANGQLEMFQAEVAPKPLRVKTYPEGLEEFWQMCREARPEQRLPTSICLRLGMDRTDQLIEMINMMILCDLIKVKIISYIINDIFNYI